MRSLCPCDSNQSYNSCCGRFHQGAQPATALELMRSRYAAFAVGNIDYIINTTHPENPSYTTNQTQWQKELLQFCRTTRFERLEILDFSPGETEAVVTFVAHLSQQGSSISFQEKSRFLKVNDQWLYHSGEIRPLQS